MTHTCPGGCGRAVPHHRFACHDCWFELPAGLRRAISANYRIRPNAHAEAMSEATAWYRRKEGERT